MNVRDPFKLRNTNALSILQGRAAQAAVTLTQQAFDGGALALETGKQAVEDMSNFAIPKNVPSFSNPQRELENRVWGASGVTARSNGYAQTQSKGMMEGMQDRVGNLFGEKNDLPLYKDKPSYPKSRRNGPWWKKKRILAGIGLLFMFTFWMLGLWGNKKATQKAQDGLKWLQRPEKPSSKVDWLDRRERVVEAFKLSWDAYRRYGWGYDEYHPIAKRGNNMTPKGMGWIIVDSLDTLMLMNLTSRLTDARHWLSTKLDYEQDQEVNTFETTIRMLGGLLSAHYLSTTFPDMAPLTEDDQGTAGEDLYLEKAKDLADRIIGAFDSPSGVPYASFNLKTYQGVPSHADGGASSTAEATTLQLELKYLTKLTGEVDYWQKAERVMQVIDDNGAEAGLVPIYVYATTGKFRGDNIRLGSRGDSYYEYLIKQYLQTSKKEKVYLDMWNEALAGVRKHLITYSSNAQFTVLGERPNGLGGSLSPKVDHLVCFMGGTIALAATGGLTEAEAKKLPGWGQQQRADMRLAKELTQSCWAMYKIMKTGLAAEITQFNVDSPPHPESAPHLAPKVLEDSDDAKWKKDVYVKGGDKHNLQRPETVETLFYMWRITGDETYREMGWEMFKSFLEHTAVEQGGGFSSLSDADQIPPVTKDNMESFWLAETLKYFYLLFSPNDLLPLDQVVINTEAHPFPRFEMGSLMKTGWARKPRGPDGKLPAEPEPVHAKTTINVVTATQTTATQTVA